MADLKKHIEELDQLMKAKGYDGYFLAAGGYPGKLKDSLNNFAEFFSNGGEYGCSFPPALTTYCYWKNEQSESVQCRFILDYQETKGFRIKNVELESSDKYGFRAKHKVFPVSKLTDIPTPLQAKIWGLEPEKHRNRKSKGLKF